MEQEGRRGNGDLRKELGATLRMLAKQLIEVDCWLRELGVDVAALGSA